MIQTRFDDSAFIKKMNNIVKYSEGFLSGVKSGQKLFLSGVGKQVVEILKQYIDSSARIQPEALHHVYEWTRTGSPSARLFDINYTVSYLGLSFKSTFRQSLTVKSGSKTPFYNKARIMEDGIPVVIRPKYSKVLVFEENGETVFTKSPVVVENPGGPETRGSFEKTFDSFFKSYFSQSFLKSSGILDYLKKPTAYKKNLRAGTSGGKTVGISTGYRWIIGAAGVKA
jgi:hypothetical protein